MTELPDMGYTKLFGSIVASTIWREDDKTRIVWITMLALKNERHMVEASLPGLADLARVTVSECEHAIKVLESPDKYSRNQEHQGRRIERIAGGWLILNGEFYRRQMNEEDRREYKRKWQAEYRAKKASAANGGLTAREIIKRNVENDPITKADNAAIKKKNGKASKPANAVDAAFDLDYADAHGKTLEQEISDTQAGL